MRGHGFEALAKKYNIEGGRGKKLISSWYSKWDGTESSVKKQSGGDRRSILTQKEKKQHIRGFVDKSKKEAVQYSEVKDNVEKKTGKTIALRTVQTCRKSLKISSKKRKRVVRNQGRVLYFCHLLDTV